MPRYQVVPLALLFAASVACGDPTGEKGCSLSSLDLTSVNVTIFVRRTVAVTPAAIQAAGANCTTAELADLSWSSNNPDVATVSANGTVTGVAPGTARITATLLGESASIDLAVIPTVATAVAVTPSSRTLGIGATQQFTHRCLDSDDFDTTCPSAVAWSTTPSPSAVASVNSTGLVTANAVGTVTLNATVGARVGTANVTVTGGTPNEGVLFRMDLSPGAYPFAGFDAVADTVVNRYRLRHLVGVGPQGQNAYRLQVLQEAQGIQPYVGWGVTLPQTNPFVYGGRVYVRFRFRWMPGTRCESHQEGSPNSHRSKFHMVNDPAPGGNSEGRAIIQIDCIANSGNPNPAIDSVTYGLMRSNGADRCNSDGTLGFPNRFTHSNDTTWLSFQYEHAFSSSANANNGSYALWIDNGTYASPNCRVPGIVINTNGSPSAFRWGFYWNSVPFAPTGIIGYELTDYEIGTTFDPDWNN